MCRWLLGCTASIGVIILAMTLTELYYYMPIPSCKAGDRCLHCAAGKPASCKDTPTFASEFLNAPTPQENIDMVKSLYLKRLERKQKANQSFNIFYIGPNTFDSEAALFGSMVPDELKSMVKMVIVEPLLGVHPEIKQHAASHGFSDVTVVQAAVGVKPELELHMWWFEEACLDRVLQQWVHQGSEVTDSFEEWKSSLKTHLSRVTTFNEAKLRGFLQDLRDRNGGVWKLLFPDWLIGSRTFAMQYLKEDFKAATNSSDAQYFQLRDSIETCIEPMEVPVLPPAKLLAQYGLTPESLDVVYCDAEGYDIEIMREVMALKGYKPFFQMVEWTGYSACCDRQQLLELVRNMSSANYDVYQCAQDFAGVLDEASW
eukprot:TRINITY_DN113141_c0_g1_i1.p1 TRINITY_DN113141_c0_g1~~TRINITY_DN113141_c0_g1_i1.p1  ORF type:complete len:372 (+),score=79.84 TRINITY_DN113141_c0_g1_i1:23-1138(+)